MRQNHFELNVLIIYNATLIEIVLDFHQKTVKNYSDDFVWKKTLNTILKNETFDDNAANLLFSIISTFFEIDEYIKSRTKVKDTLTRSKEQLLKNFFKNKLVYHVNSLTNIRRLCIFFNCVKNIMQIAHEKKNSNFVKCFKIIFKTWYVKILIKHLKVYICHCLECFVLQIKRHSSYEDLQLIDSSSLSFHIITLNFILVLSLSKENWDTIMSVTDKYTKRIILISKNNTFQNKKLSIAISRTFRYSRLRLFKDNHHRQKSKISFQTLKSYI